MRVRMRVRLRAHASLLLALVALTGFDYAISAITSQREAISSPAEEIVSDILDPSLDFFAGLANASGGQCRQDIMALYPGNFTPSLVTPVGRLVLDACGKPSAGLLVRPMSIYMPGSYEECLDIGSFVHYCLVQGLNSTQTFDEMSYVPFISWGICIPASCKSGNVQAFLNNITEHYLRRQVSTIQVHCAAPSSWTAGSYAAVACCCCIAGLIIFGTVVDHFFRTASKSSSAPSSPRHDFDENSILRARPSGDSTEGTPLLDVLERPRTRHGIILDFLGAFSLGRNWPRLFNMSSRQQGVGCFEGMRTISMLWVLCGHTFMWMLKQQPANIGAMLALGRELSFQFVINTQFAVDTFFFISGFLVCYSTLSFLETGRRFRWLRFYWHRYFRLTPAYAFVMLFYLQLSAFLGSGPFWFLDQDMFLDSCTIANGGSCNCRAYWWANLLYIQNLYPGFGIERNCMSWTWYLAADMQFYIIAPFVILLLRSRRDWGLLLWSALFIASIVIPFSIAYVNSLSLNFSLTGAGGGDVTRLVLDKPYCRIAPYLIGILCAYIYSTHRLDKAVSRNMFNRFVQLGGWGLSLSLIFLCVYVLSGSSGSLAYSTSNQAGNAIWLALARPVWSLALAWVTLSCVLSPRGLAARFLASPAWLPASRLTYCAYLIHPIVMNTVFNSLPAPLMYSAIMSIYFYIGNVALSYAAAILLCIGVEMPLANLEKRFLAS